MPDALDPTAAQTFATPQQDPTQQAPQVQAPKQVTPTQEKRITSPDEARMVANLIKSGKISGAGRDTAMKALMDFDKAYQYEQKPHGDVKPAVERMGTGEKLARGFAYGAEKVGRGIKQIGAAAVDTLGPPEVSIQELRSVYTSPEDRKLSDQDLKKKFEEDYKKNSYYEDSQKKEDSITKQNAPVLKTGAGRIGDILGGVAATGPAALLGGETLPAAAAIGGAMGAEQPVGKNESRLSNTVLGAAGGAAGQQIGRAASKTAEEMMQKIAPTAAAKTTTVAAAGVTPQAARALKSDYKLPPSMAKKEPGHVEDLLESVGGKIRTEQQLSIENQLNSNKLARRDIGMPLEAKGGDNLITKGDLVDVRNKAGQAYKAIRQLPIDAFPARNRAYYGQGYYRGDFKLRPTQKYLQDLNDLRGDMKSYEKDFPNVFKKNKRVVAQLNDLRKPMSTDDMVELSNSLREQAKDNFRSRKPSNMQLGRVQKKAAKAIDDQLEQHLSQMKAAATDPQVRKMFDDAIKARQTIAKTYDVQSALDVSGNIDAVKMARIGDKSPLSGNLAEIAHFGANFKGAARVPNRIGSRLGPKISKTELGASVVAGAMGHSAGAKTVAREVLMAGSPATARKIIASNKFQNTLKEKNVNPKIERAKKAVKRGSVSPGVYTLANPTGQEDEENNQ